MSKYYMNPDIRELQIGDIVCKSPAFLIGARPLEGKVVYIHPKLRFYTLEFPCESSRIRESFCPYGQP